MNRRTFLKKTLTVGGVSALAGVGAYKWATDNGVWRQFDDHAWHLVESQPLLAASTIINHTALGTAEKRISLASSNFGRLLPTIPGGWTKLRIGLRCMFNDPVPAPVVAIVSKPRMAWGLCSGTTNLFLDATTTNFIGVITDYDQYNPTNWVAPYYAPSYDMIRWNGCKRVGSTLTVGATARNGMSLGRRVGDGYPTLNFVEITKGSPTWRVVGSLAGAPMTNQVIDSNTFLAQVALTTPTLPNHYATSDYADITFDESAGTIDAVCIAWDRSNVTFEISDLAIVKLA
jgi:hypothetical protein